LKELNPALYPDPAAQEALLAMLVHKFTPKTRRRGNSRTPASDIVDALWEAFNHCFPYAPKKNFHDLLVAIVEIYEISLGDLEYQLKRIEAERRASEKAFDQYSDDIENGRVPKGLEREVAPEHIEKFVQELSKAAKTGGRQRGT
jgi:hypothetical protein